MTITIERLIELAELSDVEPQVVYLVDRIFKSLPDHERPHWPGRMFRAIRDGADRRTGSVWHNFAVRLLDRCVGYVGDGDESWRTECREVISTVRDLHRGEVASNDRRWKVAVEDAADAADAARRGRRR